MKKYKVSICIECDDGSIQNSSTDGGVLDAIHLLAGRIESLSKIEAENLKAMETEFGALRKLETVLGASSGQIADQICNRIFITKFEPDKDSSKAKAVPATTEEEE